MATHSLPAMKDSIVTAAKATLVVLALGACASSTSDSGQTSTGMGFTAAQLCALATTAEVSAALGAPVDTGVGSGVNAPSCTWSGSGAGATIAASEPSSVGQVPFGLQGLDNHRATAVSGLGDAAFFAAAGDLPDAELDIRKGGRAITITAAVTGITQAAQEAAEQAIGTVAVKRF
jgi:hypothetical protein